ncbi:DUF2188 domain-containing protein [Cupriavidus necator]|uniref:DUF2188 domain-containing protein n=1 Tax=Cupriavidus necator TaxID=106590 RepID=UPI00339D5417
MHTRIIRVLPAESGWALETEGLVERPQRFSSLEAAIAAGWDRAKREQCELHIHRQDGTVRLRSGFAEESASGHG